MAPGAEGALEVGLLAHGGLDAPLLMFPAPALHITLIGVDFLVGVLETAAAVDLRDVLEAHSSFYYLGRYGREVDALGKTLVVVIQAQPAHQR